MKNFESFKLESYIINSRENTIEDSLSKKITLKPKVIQVLVQLAISYPKLITREELISKVWGGNVYVGERGLTNAIWNLRHELNGAEKSYIRTVRKSGYLLLVKPEIIENVNIANGFFNLTNLRKTNTIRLMLSSIVLLCVSLIFLLTYPRIEIVEYLDSNNKISTADVHIENITTAPGRELFPAISPDHKYVVYARQLLQAQTHLFIKNLLQPDLPPRQLTFGRQGESKPVWSADGKSIFFVRKSENLQECEIVKMNIDMSLEEKIATCPGAFNISFSLSSDNKTLAFTGMSPEYNKTGIYLISLDKSDATPVRLSCGDECSYLDRDFSFSSNGKYLAITRRNEVMHEDVFLYDLVNKNTTRLTNGEGDILGIAWHPDNERLVYSSMNASKREGYVININDKSITRLEVPGFSFPRFIPNTEALVYHDYRTQAYVSFLHLSKSTTAVPFPLIQSEFSHHSPHYSEVNGKLVYVSNESGYSEVWTSNTDGSHRQKITNLQIGLMSPRWSHDGKSIAFLGCKKFQKGNSLFVLNVESQNIRTLITPFQKHYRPTWSVDDRSLIAAAGNKKIRLFSMALDTNNIEILNEEDSSFAIQSSNNKIWYTKGRYQGLWMIDPSLPNSIPRQVLNGKEFVVRYNWDVTEKGIYYQKDNTDNYSINFYEFSSEKISSVVELPIRTLKRYGSMTYIPNEEKIVFTQSDYPQVDIKRLDHPLFH